MAKTILAQTAAQTVDRLRRATTSGAVLRVINYHNTPASRADEYERHLASLAERFTSCTEQDVLDLFETGVWRKSSPGLVPVLFEGYRNNYEVGLPLIEKYGFAAWFFIPSAFLTVPVAEQRSFAEGHHIGLVDEDGELIAMTWEQVRDAEARGHVIASHTRHHAPLTHETPDHELEDEIVGSQREFIEHLGHPVRTFAWLYGSEYGSDPRADAYVHMAGYELLFSNFMLQRVRAPQASGPPSR